MLDYFFKIIKSQKLKIFNLIIIKKTYLCLLCFEVFLGRTTPDQLTQKTKKRFKISSSVFPTLCNEDLFIHLFFRLSIHPSIHPQFNPSIHSSTIQPIHPFIHNSTHPSIRPQSNPSIHSSTIQPIHPFIHNPTHPLIHSKSYIHFFI